MNSNLIFTYSSLTIYCETFCTLVLDIAVTNLQGKQDNSLKLLNLNVLNPWQAPLRFTFSISEKHPNWLSTFINLIIWKKGSLISLWLDKNRWLYFFSDISLFLVHVSNTDKIFPLISRIGKFHPDLLEDLRVCEAQEEGNKDSLERRGNCGEDVVKILHGRFMWRSDGEKHEVDPQDGDKEHHRPCLLHCVVACGVSGVS